MGAADLKEDRKKAEGLFCRKAASRHQTESVFREIDLARGITGGDLIGDQLIQGFEKPVVDFEEKDDAESVVGFSVEASEGERTVGFQAFDAISQRPGDQLGGGAFVPGKLLANHPPIEVFTIR